MAVSGACPAAAVHYTATYHRKPQVMVMVGALQAPALNSINTPMRAVSMHEDNTANSKQASTQNKTNRSSTPYNNTTRKIH
jgi:hypothetical protein